MKQYKPGQFVSIGGKLARVCKRTSRWAISCCNECITANNGRKHHCFLNSTECAVKLGMGLYPKLIKQCKKQEKL